MAGCFTACSSNVVSAAKENKDLQIVTTIFPEYDWVMNILGENPAGAEVTMLLDNGTDLHSFQPTVEDILKISKCDVFVYVGGESDEWVDDVLKEATNKDMIVISLMDELGNAVKEEEIIEGEDHKIAETIISNTVTKDQKILSMDSMQATTAADVRNGTTYISVMENNFEVLKEALY